MRVLNYSTRILGGTFALSLSLSAQTFTTLHNFGSQSYDGILPQGGVIQGPNGALYGTTFQGGRWGRGTVYELLPPVSRGEPWTDVVLHSFKSGGANLTAGLVMGPNGALYGVAPGGIVAEGKYGMAFELDPPTEMSGDWIFSIIYQFTETDGDPSSSLIFGSPFGCCQSLYGTTFYDGLSPSGPPELATVYRMTPPPAAGALWTHTILYTFPGLTQGMVPEGSLAVGSAGTLFGVTADGGYVGGGCGNDNGCGTVFSLTPPTQAGGTWTKGILHAFNPGLGDGAIPTAGMVIGPSGVLYGTTSSGGEGGGGVVFSLTPTITPGAPMTETILYAFPAPTVGSGLPGTLLLGPTGVLYGTRASGGASGYGTVFALTPPASPGGIWTETILHNFTNGADGGYPTGLTLSSDGTLYGTTYYGGANSFGTVFALRP
jgi:uncharacterized repeat protein (TIGR03803 family)